MAEGTPEFLQIEYDALRTEMNQMVGDARALERYIAAGCAAIWAWVATHPESPRIALTLPLLLAIFGAIRDHTYAIGIGRIGEYLHTIEAHYLSEQGPQGWEHWLLERETIQGPAPREKLAGVAIDHPLLLWGALFFGGLLALWQLPTGRPQPKPATVAAVQPCPLSFQQTEPAGPVTRAPK